MATVRDGGRGAAGKLAHALEALRVSEERYRRLFEDDLTGDCLSTPDGRIVTCNPAFVRIFGFADRDEALRTPLSALYPSPADHAALLAVLRAQGKLERHEGPRIRRDGTPITVVENAVASFDAAGNLVEVKSYVFDDTERKRAEQAVLDKDAEILRHLERVERLNTALKVLLDHREQESRQKDENIRATLEKLVLPYLEQLKASRLDASQQAFLEILDTNLRNVTSSFARQLATWHEKLTPTEIQVADMVLAGKRSKEIASALSISESAVAFHRTNIRTKLGLKRTATNLVSYLRSISTSLSPIAR